MKQTQGACVLMYFYFWMEIAFKKANAHCLNPLYIQIFFQNQFLLEYSHFTMLCQILLHSKNESALGTHVSLRCWIPVHAHHHMHEVEIPVSYSRCHRSWVLYITQCVCDSSSLPIPPSITPTKGGNLVSIYLFSMFVSLFLLCR